MKVLLGHSPSLLLTIILTVISVLVLFSAKHDDSKLHNLSYQHSYIMQMIPYLRLKELNLAPIAGVVPLFVQGPRPE